MKLPTKKEFTKDWGKKCNKFSPLCGNCVAWHAWESLIDLYQLQEHIVKFKSKKL